jgi:hypothetical protein
VPTFRRNLLLPSSEQKLISPSEEGPFLPPSRWSVSSNPKMKAECFSKTFVSIYHITRRRISDDPNLNTLPRENLNINFIQLCSLTPLYSKILSCPHAYTVCQYPVPFLRYPRDILSLQSVYVCRTLSPDSPTMLLRRHGNYLEFSPTEERFSHLLYLFSLFKKGN